MPDKETFNLDFSWILQPKLHHFLDEISAKCMDIDLLVNVVPIFLYQWQSIVYVQSFLVVAYSEEVEEKKGK